MTDVTLAAREQRAEPGRLRRLVPLAGRRSARGAGDPGSAGAGDRGDRRALDRALCADRAGRQQHAGRPRSGASARHRRSRPRYLQPPDLRCAGHRLCQRPRRQRRHCHRPAGRIDRRVLRRLDRRHHQPGHRHIPVVPGHRAGDRGHRRAGHRPHQRHDRGRHRDVSGAGPDRAGADADRAPGALCRCFALLRRAGLAYPVEACACRTPCSR